MDKGILAAIVAAYIIKKRQGRKKREWVKKWVLKRQSRGVFNSLLMELRLEEKETYKNFLHMSADDFDCLLKMVSHKITKANTVMRKSILPEERLALTLRFLATGDSYHSLMYLFRIPKQTISKIVPECCQAIYEVFKDEYMKPFPFKNQPAPNRIFNYRLSRARRVVENVFGLLASRFRILRNTILLQPEKVITVVSAIVCIHNFLISRNSNQIYLPPGTFDQENELEISTNESSTSSLLSLETFSGHNYSNASKEVREEFKNYFM
ncbi:hypothetical protein J437_LFUL009881 [Ladona fulva]|uniref:DDE Tnp4 domain-containing protein n=1 Tax=Ladona fulva TaxID=123851 RepID=A0A8K0K9M0_LADFU|nr:hypothetical protein J437_LFUL009881 [Ladona fulva]